MLRGAVEWRWLSAWCSRARAGARAAVLVATVVTAGPGFADTHDPPRFLYFSGADLWRDGASFHGGLRFSPHGVDGEGFTLKALLASGTYRYRSAGTRFSGTNALAAIMPGWQFVRGKFIATLYAGPEIQHHHITPNDPGNRARGTHLGLRSGVDLWWEPDAQTMLAGSLSYATIGDGYWARAAAGWRLLDRFWVGPEAILAGDRSYAQAQLGLHLTGFKFRQFEWTLAGGWSRSYDGRNGAYGRFGLLTRR